MLYDDVIDAIDGIVDEYIDDSEILKFNEILDKKLLDDPDYDETNFIDDFNEICSDIEFYYDDYIKEQLDRASTYVADCLQIIDEDGYGGWDIIAYDYNGGEPFDSIFQLAYCILLNNFYQEKGEKLLAEKVYDLITS